MKLSWEGASQQKRKVRPWLLNPRGNTSEQLLNVSCVRGVMNGEGVLFHDHLDCPVLILGISLLPCTGNCCMKGCRSESVRLQLVPLVHLMWALTLLLLSFAMPLLFHTLLCCFRCAQKYSVLKDTSWHHPCSVSDHTRDLLVGLFHGMKKRAALYQKLSFYSSSFKKHSTWLHETHQFSNISRQLGKNSVWKAALFWSLSI